MKRWVFFTIQKGVKRRGEERRGEGREGKGGVVLNGRIKDVRAIGESWEKE